MGKSNLLERKLPMVRTPDGVLAVLYDEMDAFLDGNVDSIHASTISRVANSIIKALPFVKDGVN